MNASSRPSQPAPLSESDYQDQADFRYALRRFLRFSELQARESGITPQQHLLLLAVRGHPSYPAVSIGQIAERMQVRHHSASLLVERTVKRGLLSREVDSSDRRRALVSLTPEGQSLLDRITRANRMELGSLEASLFRSSFIEALRNQRIEGAND
jgi:DNA-binding MarR family transcriptional regulator